MFTEKEIEFMKNMSTTKSKFLIYIIFLLPAIVSFVNGIQKFILAQIYAQLIHKNMSEIFNGLNHGFSQVETYSGTYCLAIESLGSSMNAFVVTIVILCFLIVILTISKMYLKIIKLIESKTKQDIKP